MYTIIEEKGYPRWDSPSTIIDKALTPHYDRGKGNQGMKIKKTYIDVQPELIFDEVRDFVRKHGTVIDEEKLETYSMPNDSSSFISRGTLVFKNQSKSGKECLRVHVIGSAKGETKVIFDINEELFTQEKLSILQEDLDFVFGSYEEKSR